MSWCEAGEISCICQNCFQSKVHHMLGTLKKDFLYTFSRRKLYCDDDGAPVYLMVNSTICKW